MIRIKKSVLCRVLLFTTGIILTISSHLTFALETQGKPLFATISSPNSSRPIEVNPLTDPELIPEDTFEIHGVAQPHKLLNLYSWAVIPGTDGNTNPDQTLTQFTADILKRGQIQLHWQPRTMLRQKYAQQELLNTGVSCQTLKNHCLPRDGTVSLSEIDVFVAAGMSRAQTDHIWQINSEDENTFTFLANSFSELQETLTNLPIWPPIEENLQQDIIALFQEVTSPIGKKSIRCTEGNVPLVHDCSLEKNFIAYHEIIKPDLAKTQDPAAQIDLFEPEGANTLRNNTNITPQSCPDCSFDPILPLGWLYMRGPFATATQTPLLTTDFQDIPFQTLALTSQDNAHYLPQIFPTGNHTNTERILESRLIPSGKYLPNITKDSYSSVYVFSYANFGRVSKDLENGGKYEVFGFYPIKDKIVLIDAFDQYEIYALSEDDPQFAAHSGITRENGTLLKIIKDPSLDSVTIDYSEHGLDPNKTYHFAIFEIRESGHIQLPQFISDRILKRNNTPVIIAPRHCFTGREWNGQNCHPVVGHTISSSNEVRISFHPLVRFLDDITIGEFFFGLGTDHPVSPQKTQWELFEQQGSYTSDPIVTDADGNIKSGVNSDEPLRIFKGRMNRFATLHYISGTYYSDDTVFSTDRDKAFSISSNRAAATAFNVNTITQGTTHFSQAIDPYGVVFDAHTKEILSDVTIELIGTTTRNQEAFRSVQQTSADGLFSFLVEQGEYMLNVSSLQNRANTFLFPSLNYLAVPSETGKNISCGKDGIFTEIYCQQLPITVANTIQHRDIPLDPPIRGNINGNREKPIKVLLLQNGQYVTETWSTPEGKFSFFVSPGTYQVQAEGSTSGQTIRIPGVFRPTASIEVFISSL